MRAGRLTRVIVVRHGQTEWNVEARIQGQGDSRLTAEGLSQAQAIAARLATEPFDVLVSSDLGRAAETARAIGERCAKPTVFDTRLRERCFGVGEGMTYEEIDRAYPGAFANRLGVFAFLGIGFNHAFIVYAGVA